MIAEQTGRIDGPADEVEVLIVGAGVLGIHQLYSLTQAGVATVLVEAGDGVGGTWFWNRYPGARLDSESYSYGYIFSQELFDEWEWDEHFTGQARAEQYFNHVVDKFDLRRHMRLGTRVTSARWDEDTLTWTVGCEGGAQFRSRFLIAATGVLSVPYFPDVEGRTDFRGIAHHTARWPENGVDVVGKRVAVIGTGSSGVQVVPAIVGDVASLTVYQRNPNWCTPLNNAPITSEEQVRLREDFDRMCELLNTSRMGLAHVPTERTGADDTPDERRRRFEEIWRARGFGKTISHYADLVTDESLNREWCDFIADKIRDIVEDPALAEKLIPKHELYSDRRPPFVTNYFEAFNDPKVSLVDLLETPIVRVTETGIETTDGHRQFDVIVWATGFDFGTGALSRLGVRGIEGLALEKSWEEGPSTYLGLMTAGFPNFFFPGGPHGSAGNVPRYADDQIEFVTSTIEHMRAHGLGRIEVRPAYEREWTEMIDRLAPPRRIGSYFFGANIPGKASRYLLNSGGRFVLRDEIARATANGYQAFELGTVLSTAGR